MELTSNIISDIEGTINIFCEEFQVLTFYSRSNNKIVGFCDGTCDFSFGKETKKFSQGYRISILDNGTFIINDNRVEVMAAKELLKKLYNQLDQ